MNRTIFLDIAAVLQDNAAPIAPNGSAGTYIYIFSDHYVAGHDRLRVYKGRGVDDRAKALEFVKHSSLFEVLKVLTAFNPEQPGAFSGNFQHDRPARSLLAEHRAVRVLPSPEISTLLVMLKLNGKADLCVK